MPARRRRQSRPVDARSAHPQITAEREPIKEVQKYGSTQTSSIADKRRSNVWKLVSHHWVQQLFSEAPPLVCMWQIAGYYSIQRKSSRRPNWCKIRHIGKSKEAMGNAFPTLFLGMVKLSVIPPVDATTSTQRALQPGKATGYARGSPNQGSWRAQVN